MNTVRNRPVSVAHLVFALIFLGIAVIWAVGAATDADVPDLALLAPAVLIGAGAVGLIGIVVNARNARVDARQDARRRLDGAGSNQTDDDGYADTGVLDHKEQ